MDKLRDYVNSIRENGQSMDSLIIYKNGQGYLINKKLEEILDVRSVSKTILMLALGLLIEQSNGEFNENSIAYQYLADKYPIENKKNKRYFEEITVRDLITHTTGYRDLLLMARDLEEKEYDSLIDRALNYPIYHKPGSYFLYSNAGYILIAAVMQEYLGYDLFEFIEENLFKPLDIKGASWVKYGNYVAGGSKLHMKADDMLKIGKLMLNKGVYEGRRIINSDWIEKMVQPYFRNTHENQRIELSEDYYGYGMWISDTGVSFASGTGGQLIVLLEKEQIIIVTTNRGKDSKAHRIKHDVDEMIQIIKKEGL